MWWVSGSLLLPKAKVFKYLFNNLMLGNEIDDSEFLNFAIENFEELFSYIKSGIINIRIHRDTTGKMWFGVGQI